MVENAPKEIEKLLSYMVKFDKANGDFELGREGAHSFRRILHHRDATGAEIENKLVSAIKSNKHIFVREKAILLKLSAKGKTCYGALFLNLRKNSLFGVEARCTILATGGVGQVYKHTTNPRIATGDGIAAAYKAGAEIKNMEFVQFHPTALNGKSGVNFLISESLRGEGALIINKNNNRFIKHRLKELAPRDVLAKEIFDEMEKNKVYLDISHKGSEFIKSRFPNIYKKCLEFNIDITKYKIPISPAAHFLCGGIKTDSYGRTTIKNLFAVGECACTGVHGANRLASNSLLECLVFSARAAEKAKVHNDKRILPYKYDKREIIQLNKDEERELAKILDKIKKIMWEKAGIVRTKKGLKGALMEIKTLKHRLESNYNDNMINKTIMETKSMVAVAKLIIEASLKRNKSIGCFCLSQ